MVTGTNGKGLGGPEALVVALTYQNQSGGSEQKTVLLPWTLEFTAHDHSFLYISAQKQSEDGTVHAVIYVNGNLVQEAESTSSYGIATVSGRVP